MEPDQFPGPLTACLIVTLLLSPSRQKKKKFERCKLELQVGFEAKVVHVKGCDIVFASFGYTTTMSTLKRKDAPGGNPPPKSAKNTKEGRPSKKEAPAKDAKSPTKAHRKPESATEERTKPAVVSVLKDDEPVFPRGGGSVLTPLEQKKIQMEAKADAIREEEFETSAKSQKKKAKKAAVKSDKKTEKKAEEDSIRIESLNFKVQSSPIAQLRSGIRTGTCANGCNRDWSRDRWYSGR